MRRFSMGIALIASAVSSSILLSSHAQAAWQICNRTNEKLYVAVAYDPGNGHHISEGWYELNACGGCATIGSFSVKGVWYRAEGQGNAERIGGNDMFCVHKSDAFKLGKPNSQGRCSVSSSSSSKLIAKGFRPVHLTAKNFTSNINGKIASKPGCID